VVAVIDAEAGLAVLEQPIALAQVSRTPFMFGIESCRGHICSGTDHSRINLN